MPPSARRNAKPGGDETHVGEHGDVERKQRRDRILEANCKLQVRFCTTISQSPEQGLFKGNRTHDINLSSWAIF